MIVKELPYPKPAWQYAAKLQDLDGCIWLDSCNDHINTGQFDILTAAPVETITVVNQQTHLNQQPVAGDVFTVLQQRLARTPLTPPHAELPFTTGLIGYIGYDCAWQLESLPPYPVNDIQLPQATIGLYHWSIISDHQQQRCFIVGNTQQDIDSAVQLLQRRTPSARSFRTNQPFQSNFTPASYRAAFSKLMQHIIDGDCYQACLCQRFATSYTGSPWDAYKKLRATSPAPFSAYLNSGQGSLVSCSPERFLQVQERQVITQPIKGTAPRFNDTKRDRASLKQLLASSKDHAENLMIVDLLRNDLSKVCAKHSVKVTQLCAAQSFSNVHHLVSTIIGTLQPQHHSMELLKGCFPGGSITGAPKISAMNILSKLEPHHRSAYTGTIFYCDQQGNLDSSILIRTLLCDPTTIYCHAGGGIVYDSTADNEYQECHIKVNNLIQCLESK